MDRWAAMAAHDAALSAVLDRYGLTDRIGARHLLSVYEDEYPLIKDLPLAAALDHVGQIAAMELGRPWRSPPRI
jgi:hypothetical protein